MSRLERKNTLIAYSFLAPNFLGFAIFTLVPVVFSVFLSLVEWNGGAMKNMKWVGLENYADIFKIEKVIEKFAEGDFTYFFRRVDLGIALKNTMFYVQIEEIPVMDARMAKNYPGSIWRLQLTDKAQKTHDETFTIERRKSHE